jgi:hypothetical protein
MFELKETPIERRLSLSPFPRNLPDNVSEAEFNHQYREAMIRKAGIAIFIAGTSRTAAESRGVLEEYAIARRMGKIPIPIGATGFAARRIWETIDAELQAVYDGTVSRDLFNQLNNPSLSNEQLVNAVFEIVTTVGQSIAARSTDGAARAARFLSPGAAPFDVV